MPRGAILCVLSGMLLVLSGCRPATPDAGGVLVKDPSARAQVEATERAFAKTMADRDFAAFERFLSKETVFFSGPTPLHGATAVSGYWKRFFEGQQAPFSWEPDQVEVLESGTLALSTGPVQDPTGKVVGRFSSIWRQETAGVWRIVFDRGESAPAPPK